MSKAKWNPFPDEEPPKGKKLLVTEESAFSDGKFVSLKWWRSGSKEWFPDSWFATQTAWMQAPDPFVPKERKNRRRKRMTKANWHPFPQEKPDKEGFYLVTIKNNSTGNLTIDLNFWGVHSFWSQNGKTEPGFLSFNGFSILAWTELPKPYEPPTTELYEPPLPEPIVAPKPYEPPLPTPLDVPKPYAPSEPEDMHPDAVTARAYAAGDPETIKRLRIFD